MEKAIKYLEKRKQENLGKIDKFIKKPRNINLIGTLSEMEAINGHNENLSIDICIEILNDCSDPQDNSL